MRSNEATVTSQGQVTIPVAVRRRLGLTAGTKVSFVQDEDGLRLIPRRYTLESARGAVVPLPATSRDGDEEIEAAIEDALADRR